MNRYQSLAFYMLVMHVFIYNLEKANLFSVFTDLGHKPTTAQFTTLFGFALTFKQRSSYFQSEQQVTYGSK